MFQSQVPTRFCASCILIATYLVNRLPNSVLNFKTPHELLFSTKPTYTHLKNFGCLCFMSTLKHGRTKFEARAQNYVFLGYPVSKKASKVYNLVTKQIHLSRDLVFHEDYFSFQLIHSLYLALPISIFLSSNYGDDDSTVSPNIPLSEDQSISSQIPYTPQTSSPNILFQPSTSSSPQISVSQPYILISSILSQFRRSTRATNLHHIYRIICTLIILKLILLSLHIGAI